MDIMKKNLAVTLCLALLTQLIGISVFAAEPQKDFTAYVLGNLEIRDGSEAFIGNAIVNGTVTGLGYNNRVKDGQLYVKDIEAVQEYKNAESWYKNKIDGYGYLNIGGWQDAAPEYRLNFAPTPKNLPERESLTVESKKTAEITESGAYDLIDVEYGTLVIRPMGKTLRLSADTLSLNASAKKGGIEIEGDGKVIFYVNNFVTGGQGVLNRDGNADQCVVYLNGAGDYNFGTAKWNANIYVSQANIKFQAGSQIIGNIYTVQDLEIASGSDVSGFIYAPNANLKLEGGSTITGRVIVNDLLIDGPNVAHKGCGIKSGPYSDIKTGADDITVGDNNPGQGQETPAPPVSDIPDGERPSLIYPYAYLYGYPWGTMGPDQPISREEAATLVYRLLKENNALGGFERPDAATFADLPEDTWSFAALEYMTQLGVYSADSGVISPEEQISRREVAKMLCFSLRLRPLNDTPLSFSDLAEDDFYYPYFKALVDQGIINGYSDNTVRPGEKITRAEFVKMFNILIARDDAYDVDNVQNPYSDLDETHWAYKQLLRAANGFTDAANAEGKYEVDPNRIPGRDKDYE